MTLNRRSILLARIIAFIIDFVVVSILAVILYWIMGKIQLETYATTLASFLLISKDIINGQSFGKWCLNIQVRDKHDLNRVPSIVKLMLRNVTLIIWVFDIAVLALDKNNEKIGDKLAKTNVVFKR